MAGTKEFDVVIFGATGYTGQLVAEYLNKRAGEDGFKWAMAGRSAEKLSEVSRALDLDAGIDFILADSDDPASLTAMAERTKVIITTVGPYQLYGEPVVAACAETGTDYVDLCGEPAWMRQMVDKYGDTAKKTGARIVFSCGFDSIPFDLGVYFLQQNAKTEFGKPMASVKGRVRKMQGGFSGGTAASLKATLAAAAKDPEIIKLLTNPFSLAPGFDGPAQPPGDKPEYDEAVDAWVAPFIMAAINTRNIHRSNFLLDHAYGADFTYDEMMIAGQGKEGEEIAKVIATANPLGGDDGPKPGEGPTKEERESGFYDVLFVGQSTDGHEIRVGVTGDKDPGYGSTSKMISESGLCLAQDLAGGEGGIFTPAPAMGETLIARLKKRAGLTFEVESTK